MKKLLVTVLMLLCSPLLAQVLQPLGSGLPGRVAASFASGNKYLALFNDETTPDTTDYTVAYWNGTYWSYFPGLAMPVAVKSTNGSYNYHSVAIYRDTMYAGAFIANASKDADVPVSHLYRYNGSNWEPMPGAINTKNYGIMAMTVFDDKLIVAGRFQNTLNGTLVQNVAAYNGSAWSYLGSSSTQQGTDGIISSMVIEDNRLYMAGDFQNFAGTATGNIAYYTAVNGNWGGVGSPFTGIVYDLAAYNNRIAARGTNFNGDQQIRVFENQTWSAPLNLDTFNYSEAWTIGGAGNSLLIGGKFEHNGNGSSLLKYENGSIFMTGNRIVGDFNLGQRGSESFIWGDFTENNTGIKHIAKIETSAGEVAGSLFFDKNQDCIQNNSEKGLSKIQIRFQAENGSYYFVTTNVDGSFAIALPEGNYSIEAFPGRHWINNCMINYAVPVRKGEYSWVSLGQYILPNINDAELHMGSPRIPGLNAGNEVKLSFVVKNSGSTEINGPTVHFKHNTRLLEFSSVPSADNYDQSSGEATFSLVNLGMGESRVYEITLKLPADATEKEKFLATLRMGSLFNSSDAWSLDNYDTLALGTNQDGDASVLKSGTQPDEVNKNTMILGYEVRFTNTSDAFVKRAIVLDTLDKNIQIRKVDVFNYYPNNANVYMLNGILVVEFPEANLSTLESNPINSTGFIQYKVHLKSELSHNDVVLNRAATDFDSKWQGVSNVVTVVAKDPNIGVKNIQSGITLLYPNPASKNITIEFDKLQSGLLEIIDISGKSVLSRSLFNTKSANVDINELKTGLYFVRFNGVATAFSIQR